MRELREVRGLRRGVVIGDLAEVGEDVALQEPALGSGGGDLGYFGVGNALLVQELCDGGVERIGGVLELRGGGRCEALNSSRLVYARVSRLVRPFTE